MWTTYSGAQSLDETTTDRLLSLTTAMFDQRGDQQAVALLMDVHSIAIAATDERIDGYRDETNWYHEPEDVQILLLEVDAHILASFTPQVMDRISAIMLDVLGRLHEEIRELRVWHIGSHVQYVTARERLPDVHPQWRETFGAGLDLARPSNQARRDRAAGDRPAQDGLTFGSTSEVTVYQALLRLQARSAEDRTIAILPLPGARLRAGHTWTPDFVVFGGGRALVLEVDGPHHRAGRRVADDHNRDLQWRRCGVPIVRLTVEDVRDPDLLDRRLVEEIKRTLFP